MVRVDWSTFTTSLSGCFAVFFLSVSPIDYRQDESMDGGAAHVQNWFARLKNCQVKSDTFGTCAKKYVQLSQA